MPVKFNQYWRIDINAIDDYGKFILKDFVPGMNRLGIHVVAGWSVLVGGYSEILLEGVSSDLESLERALKDPDYRELNKLLLNLVRYYKTKVLIQNGGKYIYSTELKENTVKLTQMWDTIAGRKEDYAKFIQDDYGPLMEDLGIRIAGEWEVLIGDGPRIIYEGRVEDAASLIGNLQGEKFREAKRELKRYVENYESRLLAFHIQKMKGYKSAGYQLISF